VLSANTTPDHVTFARFRVRHEQALAGLLVASLKLCAAAGLVRLGLVSLEALLRWASRRQAEPMISVRNQIATAISANATATRRLMGSSIASS
jgi:hypothetical protein